MDFRGFSLTHQPSFLHNSLVRRKMSQASVISCPLTVHPEKPSQTNRWEFPKMPTIPIIPEKLLAVGKITCVVGGFVGSKSQRNQNQDAKFPLDTLIRQEMETILRQKYFITSQQKDPCMMFPEKEEMKESVVEGLVNLARRLTSECSVDSNESDFIVFDDDTDDDFDEDDEEDTEDDEDNESVMPEPLKKVRFNPNVEVRVMRVWDYASRAARISPWQQIGRDRVRFTERISNLSEILTPILKPEHRTKIYANLYK